MVRPSKEGPLIPPEAHNIAEVVEQNSEGIRINQKK